MRVTERKRAKKREIERETERLIERDLCVDRALQAHKFSNRPHTPDTHTQDQLTLRKGRQTDKLMTEGDKCLNQN